MNSQFSWLGMYHPDDFWMLYQLLLEHTRYSTSYHSRGNKLCSQCSCATAQLCKNWFRITAGSLKMLQYSTKIDVTIDTKCDYTAAFVNNNRYIVVAISTQNLQLLNSNHYSLRLCLFAINIVQSCIQCQFCTTYNMVCTAQLFVQFLFSILLIEQNHRDQNNQRYCTCTQGNKFIINMMYYSFG